MLLVVGGDCCADFEVMGGLRRSRKIRSTISNVRTEESAESAFRVRVRAELERLGWKQAELAGRTGITRARLSELIGEKVARKKVPTLSEVAAIARAVGSTTDSLLGVVEPDTSWDRVRRGADRRIRRAVTDLQALIDDIAEVRESLACFDVDLGPDDYPGYSGAQQLAFDMMRAGNTSDPKRMAGNLQFTLDAMNDILAAAGLFMLRLNKRAVLPAEGYPRMKPRARPELETAAVLGERLARDLIE